MAKLDIKNRQNKVITLRSDSELIEDLIEHGFDVNFQGHYTKRLRYNKAIQVTFDLKVILFEISNPGRDETWDSYQSTSYENTEQLAAELSSLLNQML